MSWCPYGHPYVQTWFSVDKLWFVQKSSSRTPLRCGRPVTPLQVSLTESPGGALPKITPELCVELSLTISIQYFSTLHISSGSFPTASLCSQDSAQHTLHPALPVGGGLTKGWAHGLRPGHQVLALWHTSGAGKWRNKVYEIQILAVWKLLAMTVVNDPNNHNVAYAAWHDVKYIALIQCH